MCLGPHEGIAGGLENLLLSGFAMEPAPANAQVFWQG